MIELDGIGRVWMLLQTVSDCVLAVLCATMFLLIVFSRRQDSKGRAFALLMFSMFWMAFCDMATSFVGMVDTVHFLNGYNWESAVLATLSWRIYCFVFEYLDAWRPWSRRFGRALVVFVGLVWLAGPFTGQILSAARLRPDAINEVDVLPIGIVLLSGGLLNSLVCLRCVVVRWRLVGAGLRRRFFIGLALLVSGGLTYAVPLGNSYSGGLIMFALSVLLLSPAVLTDRLFDPLTRSTDQMKARIAYDAFGLLVGREARLTVDRQRFLDWLVLNTLPVFRCTAVQIRLEGDDGRLRAVALSGLWAVELVNPVVTGQRLSIPFQGGRLEVARTRTAFVDYEVEALRVLAAQVGVIIENVLLFERSEQQRLHALQTSESKTRFLSTMTHELRTPLQSIIVFVDLMLGGSAQYAGAQLPSLYRLDLERVSSSSRHLLALINDVLDLNQIEAGRIQLALAHVAPRDAVYSAVAAVRNLVRREVQVSVQLPDSLPLLLADVLRFKQVLVNLLSNAAKFCEQGLIEVSALINQSAVVFVVSDTGPGIPAAVAVRLFERFEQATPAYGGSGLGLSICKQLVELHGGQIWFTSEVGRGSTFFFSIPIADQQLPLPVLQAAQVSYVVFGRDRRPSVKLAVYVKDEWVSDEVDLKILYCETLEQAELLGRLLMVRTDQSGRTSYFR